MSVSGVGNNNSPLPSWVTHNRTRNDVSTNRATPVVVTLGKGLPADGSGNAGLQAVTGASGGPMNQQDSQSFGRSMSTLAQAIQDGDTGAAQAAFAKTKALLDSSGVHGRGHHRGGTAASADPNAAATATDPFASAFTRIGQSLQEGDLALAGSALSELDSLLLGAGKRLTRPNTGAAPSASPAGGAVDLTA
jgi:hypothetical protein